MPKNKFFTNRSDLLNFVKNINLEIVEIEQTHSANFVVYSDENNFDNKNSDAVITQKPNVLLCIRTADCLPILISFERKTNHKTETIIAAVHAGRKGTQQNILKNVLSFLVDKYQIDKKTDNKIQIFFGPAICKNCYEIDREKKLHFDLIDENKKQILSVLNNDEFSLEIDNRCTLHSEPLLHSYRRTGKGVPMNYSCISYQI